MNEEPVVEGQGADKSILDQILHRQSDVPTAVPVEDGNCVNCANHGKKSSLKDGTCETCGYAKPVS